MRRIIKFATKLYPTWWRNRYGAEFDALLEDAKPGWWDVPDILRGAIEMQMSFKTRASVAVACGVLGAALTFGASFLMPPKYESRATFTIQGPPPGLQQLVERTSPVRNRSALTGIIEARGLYPRERASQPIKNVVNKMGNAIRVETLGGHVLSVSFTYDNAALAQATTEDLADQLMRSEAGLALGSLDPPNLPRMPVSPARVNMAIFGLGAGLLLGLVLLVILPSPQAPQSA